MSDAVNVKANEFLRGTGFTLLSAVDFWGVCCPKPQQPKGLGLFRSRLIRRLLHQIKPSRREEVSAQYWSELNQLLANGEISAEIAETIERDMFAAAAPGAPRLLNDEAWQIILDGQRADLDRVMTAETERWPSPFLRD